MRWRLVETGQKQGQKLTLKGNKMREIKNEKRENSFGGNLVIIPPYSGLKT